MNSDKCLVSVVIPVKNGERTIQRCLLSVLNQSNVNLKVFIVNDGSADSTLNIVKKIQKNHKNILIYNVKFNSSSLSRNFAISKITTKYTAFIDADDVWHKEKIFLQLGCLSDKRSCGISFGSVITYDPSNEKYKKSIASNDLYSKDLIENNKIALSTVLIKTRILKESHGFDFGRAEDYRLWVELSYKYKFCHVSNAVTLYEFSTNQKNSETIVERMNTLLVFFSNQYQLSNISYCDYLNSISNIYYSSGAALSIFGGCSKSNYGKYMIESLSYNFTMKKLSKVLAHLLLPRAIKYKLFFLTWSKFTGRDYFELLEL
jgi:glycosyltransferase involved in cell wall biosynthesis